MSDDRELTSGEQQALLALARQTISGLVGAGNRREPPQGHPGPAI